MAKQRALLHAGIFAAVLSFISTAGAAEPSACITLARMRATHAVDDSTIVVTMTGRDYRRIALIARCVGLKAQDGFAFATSITQLCPGDIITVLGGGGARCGIGTITPLDATEAKALLGR